MDEDLPVRACKHTQIGHPRVATFDDYLFDVQEQNQAYE
jgi:hypothetical protein